MEKEHWVKVWHVGFISNHRPGWPNPRAGRGTSCGLLDVVAGRWTSPKRCHVARAFAADRRSCRNLPRGESERAKPFLLYRLVIFVPVDSESALKISQEGL